MNIMDSKTTPVYRSRMSPPVKIAVVILGLIGIGISSYLTYIHYQSLSSICLFNAKCDEVLASPYAQIWGVPLSLFGLLLYVALTVLAFWSLWAKEKWQDRLDMGIYAFALSGMLFTAYLYYLEIFEIHAFCSWCIDSSIVIVSMLMLSLINLFSGLPQTKEKSRSRRFKLSRYIQW